jgi:hypothetical protein
MREKYNKWPPQFPERIREDKNEKRDWMNEPRSLTPPPLPKPVALMQRSSNAPEI